MAKKSIAAVQSNYIPWKGYFDLINSVDEFVLYDSAQYTRRDWRNRNRIKTNSGVRWLTIPVKVKGQYSQKIKDTKVADKKWAVKHWKTLLFNYSKAPFFEDFKKMFEELYLNSKEEYLSLINYRFLTTINKILGIKTKLTWVDSLDTNINDLTDKTEKLIAICRKLKATEYVSGPSAKNYLKESIFLKNKVKVSWMDYSDYPIYDQLYLPFVHEVTILDLIFTLGFNTPKYMKSFKKRV